MPSKKRGCFKVLLVIVLIIGAMLSIWALANFGSAPVDGKPLFEPNELANHIVAPTNSNGDVDYIEAINLAGSNGVTVENNAMVKFVHAMGPEPEGVLIGLEYFQRLGIDRPELSRDYLKDFVNWSGQNSVLESTDDDGNAESDGGAASGGTAGFTLSEEFKPNEKLLRIKESFVQSQVWNRNEFPKAAAWVDYNERHLERVREGLQRSHYYSPLVIPDGFEPILISAQLSYTQKMREVARQLSARAGMFIGEEDFDSAFQEVMSMYQLANLLRNGQTFIDELVAIAIQGMANEKMHQLLAQDGLSIKQLRGFYSELESVDSIEEMARIISEGERFVGLDALQYSARTGAIPFEGVNIASALARMVDAEQAMVVLNGKYDELVELFSDASDVELAERASHFEDQMIAFEIDTMDPTRVIKTVLGGRRAKGDYAGRFFACLILPAVPQLHRAEVRSKALLRMTKIRLALEIFRKENGSFPEKLDDLVPSIVAKMPLDPYVLKPFRYKVEDGKVVLFSVGQNGVDEGGDGVFSEARSGGDDWRLSENEQLTWEEYLEENASSGF